ncbi:hypothetical protein PsorP6_004424 [Peronosclerospora sorghi]|uniref:Uncharacterized protein n=1 Tax=Peronosclerospora sorghi TaxID=230839 RepID=A0ACC0VPD8_9STRA|nr:hypothetical protein PsorP6_004424 [Peronosclerospora sorghi]
MMRISTEELRDGVSNSDNSEEIWKKRVARIQAVTEYESINPPASRDLTAGVLSASLRLDEQREGVVPMKTH